MAAIECGRGHLYDPDIYATCPYCNSASQAINFGGVTVDNAGRTMPISGNQNSGQNSGNKIMPIQEAMHGETSVLNDGKTLPPKGYQTSIRVDEDNKTIGMMKEKLGMDPVVGWLICICGKQIGKDYKLKGQINTIGRSEKMDICMKEDKTISFDNHARLSYSEKNNKFNLIPAESKNIIFLNDNEVFTPTLLSAYDIIDFGETKLMFVPFCCEKFDWKSNKAGDGSDVSI